MKIVVTYILIICIVIIDFFSSSRYVARNQLEALKNFGFGLRSYFDVEFTVFERKYKQTEVSCNGGFSSEDLSVNEYNNIGFTEQLREARTKIKEIRAGSMPDLFEIVLAYDLGIHAADNVFRAKHYSKEIVNGYFVDQQAVFMTKPFFDTPVCGQAFNHSICQLGVTENAFIDSTASDGISQVARYWMAGLVKHARGLTALCCPTVNCYRRLHSPYAPCKTLISTNEDAQSSSFCLKSFGTAYTCIVNRLPGGSANPYIVLAATVAAGLAGITNKYPTQERNVNVPLPQSLSEALDALEEDEVLAKTLGREFIQSFVHNKREFEVDVLKDGLTDESIKKEREMYFKMF